MELKMVFKQESESKNESKTIKYLFKTEDNEFFESVLIFEDTLTLCVSSQIGCPVRCKFCRTGKDGFARNLTAEEIVEQVQMIERDMKKEIVCVSYMGMGEPLLNLDNVLKSMHTLKKKYKLSTMVIPGRLSKLADVSLPLEVYISLHASSEEKRKELIPTTNAYRLEDVINEINDFTMKGERVNVWYLLLKDVNDSEEDAKQLILILKKLKHVNLLYLKEFCESETGFEKSPQNRVMHFQKILEEAGIQYHYSVSEGQNIKAGCGQLRRQFIGD